MKTVHIAQENAKSIMDYIEELNQKHGKENVRLVNIYSKSFCHHAWIEIDDREKEK